MNTTTCFKTLVFSSKTLFLGSTFLLFLLLFLAQIPLHAQTARSIPIARLNPESAVYNQTEDKLYVLVKDDNTNISDNSNHLLLVHPAWGRIEQKYQVGFNPHMLCQSSDQQYLYFLTDGPLAIKRFQTQGKQIQQTVLMEQEVLRIKPVPARSKNLLVLTASPRGDSMFLRLLNDTSFLPQTIDMHRANQVIGMGFANDTTVYVWRNNGELMKIKSRSDGLHLESEFTGLQLYDLREGIITSRYIIGNTGRVIDFSGTTPVEINPLPHIGVWLLLDDSFQNDEFAAVEFLSETECRFTRYNKNTLAETYRWDAVFPLRSFYYNIDNLKVYQTGTARFCLSSTGLFHIAWNCAPLVKAPLISPAGSVVHCPFADSLFLKVDQPKRAEIVWSDGSQAPQLHVGASGAFRVKYSDDLGCQTPFSISTNVTIANAPYIREVTGGENRERSPLVICKSSKTDIRAFSYDDQARLRWSNGDTTQAVRVPAGVYRVRALGQNGCLGPWSSFFTVMEREDTVPPRPSIEIVQPQAQYCSGDRFTLRTTPGFAYYFWGNTRLNNPVLESMYNTSSTATVTYSVRVAKDLYCISDPSDPVRLNYNRIPPRPEIRLEGNQLISNTTGIHQWHLNGVQLLGLTAASIPLQGGGFYAAKFVQNGCASDFSNFIPISGKVTSTQERMVRLELSVHPNPATDFITFEYSAAPIRSNQALIYSMDGKKQAMAKLSTQGRGLHRLELGQLSSGTYFFEVLTEAGRAFGKFVKL